MAVNSLINDVKSLSTVQNATYACSLVAGWGEMYAR
jgi:hypothetical protein